MNPESSHDGTAAPRGWHSRGYLPHFDAGHEFIQFVTFRLADSVPSQVVLGWQGELLAKPEAEHEAELHRMIEMFIDTGYGECHLRDPRISALVEGTLLHFDGKRYRLHAWIVMPNHVHVLFTPEIGCSLSLIVGSWKSYTSKEANKLLGRSGQFWHEDYFDRYIRNEHHFHRVVRYVEENPVKAGLCAEPRDWFFGSARQICVNENGLSLWTAGCSPAGEHNDTLFDTTQNESSPTALAGEPPALHRQDNKDNQAMAEPAAIHGNEESP